MTEHWSTANEIRFLRMAVPPFGLTRLEFLQNYKDAMALRENWDTMDKEEIEEKLNKEIEKEMENGRNF